MRLAIQTKNAEETRALGQKVGEHIPPDTVIAAFGGLGLGKTVFAKGLARGLGLTEPVTSPTYIYIQEYFGRMPFCHIDAYRMEQLGEDEIEQLGLTDCFLPGKTAYVEWPQFIRPFLPKDAIELHFCLLPEQPEGRSLLFVFDTDAQGWLTPLLARREEKQCTS